MTLLRRFPRPSALPLANCLTGLVALLLVASGLHAELTADYQFHGNFASSVGTVPALTVPGDESWSFGQDNVDGVTADVFDFDEDSGLRLDSITGVISADHYSIAILVRIDSPRIDEEDEYTDGKASVTNVELEVTSLRRRGVPRS